MAEPSPHGGGTRPIDLSLSRRNVLRGAAAGAGLGVFASAGGAIAVALGDDLPRFLSDADRKLLAAVVDRVVPGPPEDLVAGAVQAGCHEAIDALLAAFRSDPPRIFAGGPFSDRGGHPVNQFDDFLPLDAYEEKAWRLRIEGAPGVDGFQQVYQRGLAALRKSSPTFALLPGLVRDLALRTTSNPDIAAMRDLAVTHTLEFFFAAPEYGGNRALRGWQAVDFDGDVQPRGYTREEVEDPEPEMLPLLPPSLGDLLDATVAPLLGNLTDTVSALFTALAGGTAELPRAAAAAAPAFPLATTEGLAGLTAAGDDNGALREALAELLAPLKNAGSEQSRRMADLHRRAAELAAEARGGAE
ncbi:hypothetical protein HNR19_000616 [Nocardioides thalensis]|uniref:Gluconate 2-dehydrogenase subunit 3 family protein n=1 Tax=Nocardioides thalensis TaxID=1914755 RepID=A0A853BZY1_9ACTN|nr:hypothetical protein [Nocardioides thalensis]